MPSFVLATDVRSRRIFRDENVEIRPSLWTLPRNLEGDDQTAGRIVGQFETRCVAIEPGETGACVCQAQSATVSSFRQSLILDTRPVILHLDANHAVSGRRFDLDASGGGISDRVSHRIFHDGLEDEVRDANVQHLRIDVDVSGQSILKPNALDLEVTVQKLNLLLQRDFHGSGILEGQAEKITQASDHLSR